MSFQLKVFLFSAEQMSLPVLTDADPQGLWHASIADANINVDQNNVQPLAKGVVSAEVGITLWQYAGQAQARQGSLFGLLIMRRVFKRLTALAWKVMTSMCLH